MKLTDFWRYTALFAFALTLAVPAAAQAPKPGQPPFKWWNSERYRHELALTHEQSQRLEEIFQAASPTLRTQKKELDTAETVFEKLVEHGDDSAVMAQVDRVETARAALSKTRTLMLLKMRRILTSDQWIKLGVLHQASEKEGAAPHGN